MARKKAEVRRVVTYSRVSTQEQAEKDLSLPAQGQAMAKYARERSYELVQEFIEPGASARDDNRKVFKRMIEFVLTPGHRVDAILVYHTSRFFRNVEHARAFKSTLRRHGIRVIAICQETADDPSGQFVEGMFELFDEFESNMNGMRTSAAMRENARQGYYNGSHPPYGFSVEKVTVSGERRKGKLVPNRGEQEIARELFRSYVAESGGKAVARSLNQRGLLYRKGKLWTRNLVMKVIEETAAIGTYYWNKLDTKTREENDPEDWVPIPVEPYIDPDLFTMAQEVRAHRDPKVNPGRASSSPMMLAGLLKCGKCGRSYQRESSGKLTKEGEYKYVYYNCSGFCRSGKEACDGYRLPMKELEHAVLHHMAEQLFTEDRCRQILQDIVEQSGIMRQKTVQQRQALQKELEAVEKKLHRWVEAFEAGEMPEDLGAERVRELRAQRNELRETLSKVLPLRPPSAHLYSEQSIQKFQRNIQDTFLSGDNALTRNYLRFLVDEIVVHEDEIEIVGKTEAAVQMMAADGDHHKLVTAAGEVHSPVLRWLRKCSRSPTRSHGSLRDRFSPLARSRKCERLRILVVGGREPGRSLGFALSPRDNCGGQARRVRPGWPLARFGARAAQRCPGVGARHTGATARHHPGPNVPSM